MNRLEELFRDRPDAAGFARGYLDYLAEVAAEGVLANCVSPGFIDTELTRDVLGEAGIAEVVAGVPAGRLGKPEEVAALVAWLAGPENTYVSGQNILIDGGFTRV